MVVPLKESNDKHRLRLKKQRHTFADKGPCSQSYGFSSRHAQMWELDHKKVKEPKNWCFWTVVLEKTLESPLDSKEIKPINPKGNQSWIFTGRTDAEAEAPILWPLMRRANSLEKTLMLRMEEGKRRRGQQRMRWLDSITMNLSKLWEIVKDSGAWRATVHSVTKTQLKKPSMHHSLFNLFPVDGYFCSILFVSVFVFYCYITNYHIFSNLNSTHLLPHSFCGSHRLSESSAQHPTWLKLKCWTRLRYDFMWNSEFSFIFTSICRIQFLMVVKWNPHCFFFFFSLAVIWYDSQNLEISLR